MSFWSLLESIGISQSGFWTILVFLASIFIDWNPGIKWNPWKSLIKFIGSNFNTKIDAKMDVVRGEIKTLNTKIDHVQTRLSEHITESEKKSLEDTRRDILEFANACMNGRKHTKEQFDFMIKKCDSYELYIKKNEIKNGVIEAAIKEIRRLYEKCIQEHSFLKEEGEES